MSVKTNRQFTSLLALKTRQATVGREIRGEVYAWHLTTAECTEKNNISTK